MKYLLCLLPLLLAGSHALGLATTTDINEEHEDQRQVDHAIVDGSVANADTANQLHALIEELSKRSICRTLPPPIVVPTSLTDWSGIAGLAVAMIAAAGAAIVHVKGQATQKSLDATDKWVQQTENDLKANVATTARIAPRVNVVPVPVSNVQPTETQTPCPP